MESSDAHLLACFQPRPRICGRRMEVLTLGHVSLLMGLGCGFFAKAAPSPADVLLLWDLGGRRLAAARGVVRVFVRPQGMGDRVAQRLHRWRWAALGRLLGWLKLDGARAELAAWLNEIFTLPPRWEKKAKGPEAQRVPWPEHVATCLERYGKLDRETAEGLPVNVALIRYLQISDMMGDTSLMTPAEGARVKRLEAKAKEFLTTDEHR